MVAMIRRIIKVRIWAIAVLSVFFVLQFFFFRGHTQSYYFEDETEHLVPAWMMSRGEYELYDDFSTNHQPVTIFVARIVFLFYKGTHLFSLVEWSRMVMMGTSKGHQMRGFRGFILPGFRCSTRKANVCKRSMRG